MCLFIADDGSGLELCLRDDVVGVSDWACVVCILCGGGGGGGEVTVSMCSLVLLGVGRGVGLKENVCLLGGIGGGLANFNGGGA